MVDQFRQHVLCVTGKHIDKDIHITDDNVCICMINILGLSTLEAYEKQLERCVGVNGADIIMYEKVWRIGRKMGHMIVRGGTEYVVEVAKLITEIRDIELLQV